VTMFQCESVIRMLAIALMHRPMKRRVLDQVDGFLGVKLFTDWPNRSIRSVSLWTDVTSIYGMGNVAAHVKAARVPGRWGISTSCGVFEYSGDWRSVLFEGTWQSPSPLSEEGSDGGPVTH